MTEARIAGLRAELAACTERSAKAVLAYELGVATEESGDLAGAAELYKAARTADAAFRPPLFALIRLVEASVDPAVMADLLGAEAKAARTPSDEASALLDHAVLLEDRLAREKQARAVYERVLTRDPGNVAASVFAELHLRRAGDPAAAAKIAAQRAQHVADQTLARILELEGALSREHADPEGTIRALLGALAVPIEQHRFLRELERITRRHGSLHDRIEVLERLAAIADRRGKGEAVSAGLSAGSLPTYADDATARADAAALHREVARAKLRADDTPSARAALERAVALAPTDLLLRLDRMEIEERTEDFAGAQKEARGLLERGPGAYAAAIHLRIADLAQRKRNVRARIAALEAAVEGDPASAAASALLDEALAHGEPSQRIAWLERRANDPGTPDAWRVLWRAARIALDEMRDFPRARTLLSRAAEQAPDDRKTPLLRELWGAATALGDAAAALSATSALVDAPDVDAAERALLLLDRHRRTRARDAKAAAAALASLVSEPEPPAWAGHVSRSAAALRSDHAALGAAHHALAREALGAGDEPLAVAHFAAAGRAAGRGADLDGALEALREALAHGSSSYAIALLEEVLRARGETGSLAALLEQAAGAGDADRASEPFLLRSAFAAREAGDVASAAAACRRAAEVRPGSIAPRFLLQRLAVIGNDPELAREASEGLAAREIELGKPGLAVLEHGEALALASDARGIDEIARALTDEDAGPSAAAMLLALSHADPQRRRAGLDRLVADAHGSSALALRRTLAGALLHASLRGTGDTKPATDALRALLPRVLDLRKDERFARWAGLRAAFAGASSGEVRSKAFEALGEATVDPAVSAELLLYALYSGSPDDHERVTRIVEEIVEAAPGTVTAALALEATPLRASPEQTARALEARVKVAPPAAKAPLEAALGRALVLAGRHADAARTLRAVVARDASDLASWEALRAAAKGTEDYEALVQASSKLASEGGDGGRVALLAEAGMVLESRLSRGEDAEGLLRETLKLDPAHADAYEKLHAVLEARSDREALVELVSARIAVTDDAETLVGLFFEQARHQRELGHLDAAIESIQNLHTLEPAHAPGLALLADTSAALGRYDEVVQALRELACVDLPIAERRDARWAAARYLAEHLGDPAAARDELLVIERMGRADEALLSRMALLSERSGNQEEAVRALAGAAALATEPEARARYERRAAGLLRSSLNDRAGARAAYERALAALPADLDAASALAALLDRGGRRRLATTFEDAVRRLEGSDVTGIPYLEKLLAAATFAEDADFELLVLEALDAVGGIDDRHVERLEVLRAEGTPLPAGSLSDEQLAWLGAAGAGDPIVRLGDLGTPAVQAAIGADAKGLGVGKKQLVRPSDPSAARDELDRIAAAFGVATDRLYAGGSSPSEIEIVGGGGEPFGWVVAPTLSAPLAPPHKFRAAMLALAARDGALAIVDADPEDGSAALASIALAGGVDRPDIAVDEGLATAIQKAMSRAHRKAISDLESALPHDEESFIARATAERRAALRAGMLVSGDLATALATVLGEPPTGGAIRASAEATDLLELWLSPVFRSLRADLGLAVQEARPSVEALDSDAGRLERTSGFFGSMLDESAWPAGVDGLVERVVRATARERTPVPTGTHRVVGQASVPGSSERLEFVLKLARSKKNDARLWLSASELAEADGDAARSREHLDEARRAAPDDPIVVRRLRQRAGDGKDGSLADLLEAEAATPGSSEDRGLALALAAVVANARGSDAARVERLAKRAAEQRPKAVGPSLLASLVSPIATESLERAAREWKDPKAGAAVLVEAATILEHGADLTRARFLYKRAAELDPDAFDALVGAARCAHAQRAFDEAADLLGRAARLLHEKRLVEALLRAAARLIHLGAGKPLQATVILADSGEPASLEALVAAAEAAKDRAKLERALVAHAASTRRTARALTLVRLAELRAEGRDDKGAAQALRDASHADPTLDLVRLVGEAIARRSGDAKEVARVARSSGLGSLPASARVALSKSSAVAERRLLSEAASEEAPDVLALILATDAAAEAGDQAEHLTALSREAEHMRGVAAAGRLVAVSEIYDERGDAREAARAMRDARRLAPGDPLPVRRLAELTRASAPDKAGQLYLEEGAHASGERAAFAFTMAARLLAADEKAAQEANAKALEASPGHPPAVWAEEERARRSGDPARIREMVMERARTVPDARAAAELLVRGAVAMPEIDRDLLARASELLPTDTALLDLRIRAGGIDARTRGELLERSSAGASPELARALLVRAAEAYEEAGELGEATQVLEDAIHRAGEDIIIARVLDRVLLAAGDADTLVDRLRRNVSTALDDASRAIALERLAEAELRAHGDPASALWAYREILSRFPNHMASVRGVERLAMELGDEPELVVVEEHLARLGHPKDATAHSRLAVRILKRLGGGDSADADELLLAVFDHGEVDLWLARRVEAIARARKDERVLLQALTEMAERFEDPRERLSVELRLAELGARVRSPAAAANRLARALSVDPRHPVAPETLGELKERAQDVEGAAEAYLEAAKRSRANARRADLAYRAGRLLEERIKDRGRAAQAYLEAASADASTHDVLGRLERLLPEHGDAKQLAQIISSHVARGGERGYLVSLHLMLARLRRSLGDPQAAKKSLRTVGTFEPERTDVLEMLADVCLESNDTHGAVEALQNVVVRSRDADVLRRAYMRLADIFSGTRDSRRGKEVLRKVIELFPDDSEAKQRLALLESR